MRKFGQGALCVLIAGAFAGPAIAAPCTGASQDVQPILAGTPLTLDMALRQVRSSAPKIQRAALEVRARSADAAQAGRRLNPSLGVELENFVGSGPLSGFGQSETTFTLQQTFELGGKRRKRERAAQALAELGQAECQTLQRAVQLETATLFFEILAAQEVADLSTESANLAGQLEDTVSKRVEAGAAAPPELLRSRADAASLRAAAVSAQANVERKRFELAALWGSAAPQFSSIIHQSDASDTVPIPLGDILSHPDIALAEADEAARRAEQDAARSLGIPDLTVSGGLRRFEDTNDSAFVLGLSVPLPLFDKNRDAARASGLRADAARINAVATQARLQSRQEAAIVQIETTQTRLDLLEHEALPAARAAYDASVRGYAAGRFDLTTTLNARRELIEAGIAVIAARRDFNIANAELKSLVGVRPFDGHQ